MAAIFRPTYNPYLQILWNGEHASVPCLFLFTDLKKYVFNCSEGTQRLFTQRRVRLKKLDTFFMTSYQWSHMGGLPGFGMTLRDMKNEGHFKDKTPQEASSQQGPPFHHHQQKNMQHNVNKKPNFEEFRKNMQNVSGGGKPNMELLNKEAEGEEAGKMNINIYAPPGMDKIIEATKHFLRFDQSDVNFNITDKDTYQDEELTIQKITIYSSDQKFIPKKWDVGANNIQDIDYPTIYPPAVCYTCQLVNLPGRFDVKTAIKMGVPKGPMFGSLQKGETVVLPNGKKVMPCEVLGPETPGPAFLVIDCPHESYIEDLMKKNDLQKYQSQSEDEGAHLVVHLSSTEVCRNNTYREWINKFPSFTKHVFINDIVNDRIVFNSQHNLQIMLNHINKESFPRLLEPVENKETNCIHNFEKIYLRKHKKPVAIIPDSAEVRINKKKTLLADRIKQNQKMMQSFGNNVPGKRSYDGEKNPIPNKKLNLGSGAMGHDSYQNSLDYPKVVCFGTGASIPSKYRNVSATLVLNNEDEAVLLDCGEGTYGQLLRHYGDKIKDILLKIKFVFISHMHADHHLGLIMLIKEINKLKTEKDESLLVMGPSLLLQWLADYAVVSESLKFRFVNCRDSWQGINVLSNLHAQAVKVDHPGSAFGIVLNCQGVKTTYSGDTMPCSALIAAGRNSKLLIHEATLDDDMVEDAKMRKHSTTKQALSVAQEMNAEFVLLTHFSQRYPKLPIIKDESLVKRVAYAFDHMEVTPGDIPNFCKLIPILNKVFADEVDGDL